jgi:copper chaperone
MKQSFSVEGMSCDACVGHVKKALEALAGVTLVDVDLAKKQAVVEYDHHGATIEQMIEAVDEEGYSATPRS